MSQVSLVRLEQRNKGAKRTIKLPAIAAGATKQYAKSHSKLKGVIREYGVFNQMTILNNGAINIEVSLDYADSKTYPVPGNSTISLDEITFSEFNIVNIDTGTTVIDEITVIPAFEPRMLRERIKTKKERREG